MYFYLIIYSLPFFNKKDFRQIPKNKQYEQLNKRNELFKKEKIVLLKMS